MQMNCIISTVKMKPLFWFIIKMLLIVSKKSLNLEDWDFIPSKLLNEEQRDKYTELQSK